MNTTFSEMITKNIAVQWMYVGFLSFYSIEVILLIYIVENDHFNWEYEGDLSLSKQDIFDVKNGFENKKIRKISNLELGFGILSLFYCLFSAIKLAGLFMVLMFPINQPIFKTAHYVSAGMAFGGAIAASVCLFIRRCYTKFFIDKLFSFKSKHPHATRDRILFTINLFFVIVMLTMAILQATIGSGTFEFVLTLFVVMEVLFEIINLRSYNKNHLVYQAI